MTATPADERPSSQSSNPSPAESVQFEPLASATPIESGDAPPPGEERLLDESIVEDPLSEESRVSDLISIIRETADKLARDGTSRGDLKILSRTLRELRYAFKVFTPYRNRRKVTIFGSARTPPHEATFKQAIELGRKFAEKGWLVVTGAASGIMEAGHIGAGRDNSMGLNIMLPFEQSANPIILGDPKLVHMKYFFTRKLMFVKECDALVLSPGGFGTLDEGLEVLTLLQTGKRDMAPVVMIDEPGGSYWKMFHEFVVKQLLGRKLISPEDLSLYRITDNPDEAVAETLQFYRNYHSMRYVKNKLVLRMQHALSPELLAAINESFHDIVTDGSFEQRGPLREEKDETHLTEMHRLVFRFNRRSLGRLRELIDAINRGSVKK